jgi:hypothetical protein
MKVRGGQIVWRQTKQRSPETTKGKRMLRLQSIEKTPVSSSALPRRSGVVVLYTPRDEGERAVCYALFGESYNFACKLVSTDSSQPF